MEVGRGLGWASRPIAPFVAMPFTTSFLMLQILVTRECRELLVASFACFGDSCFVGVPTAILAQDGRIDSAGTSDHRIGAIASFRGSSERWGWMTGPLSLGNISWPERRRGSCDPWELQQDVEAS